MKPYFSVIIPVFNTARFLGECLESLRTQSFYDWEAVCVDDGSTDGSLKVLQRYAALDSRFRIFSVLNGGAGRARNFGLDKADGEYVLFLDSDDCYPSRHVLESYQLTLKVTGASVCAGWLQELLPNGAVWRHRSDFTGTIRGRRKFYNFRQHPVDFGFTLFAYRRELLETNGIRFPERNVYEDPVFLARALTVAGTFVGMPVDVYRYRIAYKPISWTENECEKGKAFVCGLIENVRIAKETANGALLVHLKSRISRDYQSFFSNQVVRRQVAEEIASLAHELEVDAIGCLSVPIGFCPCISRLLRRLLGAASVIVFSGPKCLYGILQMRRVVLAQSRK